ncbi:membrane-bound metal-dependent hydrolase [Pseudodesulfovibrio mercurii]|uniref:Membrane-bound metal-dependent hydrolase n=1 Tax=Pseudodesulfovibrio mercurii TaxID=641491 RepID=F0JF69_9BACT|nr:metal-dependent hydrolase [Pseudodesulfovibrio mercurii]EGB13625.1 membrane-bound metal-dependent hydrolase [Pseudodesulfovibrio mercurii]
MPDYRGHLAGGLFFGVMGLVGVILLGWMVFDPLQAAGLLGFCLLGALFPDVDTNSKGQNLYYAVFVLVDLGLIIKGLYVWAAWFGLFSMLPAVGTHRGWTHTWWAMALVPLPILVIPLFMQTQGLVQHFAPFYAAFVLGYLSHLILDGKFK